MTGVASANTDLNSCTIIDSSGSYELSGDIDVTESDYTTRESCIEINASDVTLDGNGYTIDGYSNNKIGSDGFADDINGSTGVHVAGTDATRHTNVTVRNVDFEGGSTGINATHASDIEIAGVSVANASLQAIDIHETDGNVTIRNVETENSPQYSDGSQPSSRSAIDVGEGPQIHDEQPDQINVTNLHLTESPQLSSEDDAAVELETDSGPITVTDSSISASPRGGLELDAQDGNGFGDGDATVRNVTIDGYGQETTDEEGLVVRATADLTINSTTLSNGGTSSKKSEHAILAGSDGGSFRFEDSTVRNVTSDEAVDIDAANYDRQDGTVRNVTIHNNTGGISDNGGLLASTGGSLDVRDLSITQTGEDWAGILSGESADIRNLTVDQTVEKGVQVSSFDEGTDMRDSVISNLTERQNPPEPGLDVDTEEGTYRNVTVSNLSGPGISLAETDDDFTDRTLALENSTIENVSGYGIELDGDQLDVRNTSVVDAEGAGIKHDNDVSDTLAVSVQNVSVQNISDDGIRIAEDSRLEYDDLALTDVTVRNTTGDDVKLTRVTATLTELDLLSATLDGMARSVTVDNVTDAAQPTPPSDTDDVGAYVEANNTTAAGYLNATVQYEDSNVPADLDESTLSLWRHNGSWSEVGGSVDTAANSVTANSTDFSVFAPLGTTTSATASFNVSIDLTNAPVTEGERLSVDATVNNTGTATGTQTVTLSTNGTQRDTTALTLDPDVSQSLTLNWSTSEGDAGPYTATVMTGNDSNATSVDVTTASDGDDDDDTTGGGGGSAGSASSDEDGIETTPDIEETSAIEDSSVDFETAETVGGVTFDEEATGSVEVQEYDEPPTAVAEAVSEVVAEESVGEDGAASDDESAAEDGGDGGSNPNVVTVADISPTDPDVEQSSATVEFEVAREEFDDPADAVVFHETDDGWTEIETTVEETNGETVTVAGRTDSFSLFAVAEVTSEGASQTDASASMTATDPDDASEATADTEDTDSGGAPAVVIGLLVVVGGVGTAVYVLRQQSVA